MGDKVTRVLDQMQLCRICPLILYEAEEPNYSPASGTFGNVSQKWPRGNHQAGASKIIIERHR